MIDLSAAVAADLGVRPAQAAAAIALMDEGSTVPFIARYRKEATEGLDDAQLRDLETRLTYRRELEERRAAILKSVESQGKLDDALKARLLAADAKADLEDLYLPHKPKRRTKAMIAREQGLEPLAEALIGDPSQDPQGEAARYISDAVPDAKAALDGARQILMERFAEDADLMRDLRDMLWTKGRLVSRVADGKQTPGAKFSDYFDFSQPIKDIPAHRALALFRGRREEFLDLALRSPEEIEAEQAGQPMIRFFSPQAKRIAARFGLRDQGRAADPWLLETARWTWRVKLAHKLETDLFGRLFEQAEDESIRVFAANLRDLLLAAPAGRKGAIGLDPGYRSGVKVAVVDSTGKLLDTATIYPHEPQRRWDQAMAILGALAQKHGPELIAVGDGTASRETEKLANELRTHLPRLTVARVSEAGASVYSASEYASQEFPDVDVSLRGAASIARRLQDPLAELVKIDPKSIGVGQYQHDIGQSKLARSLDAVVEDCVNAVGVDVNTASAPLLTRVAGLNATLARNIVALRDEAGAFRSRKQILKTPRLGPKAFEQAAGFLRVMDGDEPLDASAVHPEAYPVVQGILAKVGGGARDLIGDSKRLQPLRAEDFANDQFGVPTVRDILAELEKPGRDPRPEFKTATYKEGVEKITDLQPGMMLEGTVTNVANFGAFIDVGVHQDGLAHVSALADRFVKDPREVVRPGQVVMVKVLEVDVPRKRIALTLRMGDQPGAAAKGGGRSDGGGAGKPGKAPARTESRGPKDSGGGGADNAMAAALRAAMKKR